MEFYGNKKNGKKPSHTGADRAEGGGRKKNRALRTLLTVLLVIAALIAAAAAAYTIWEKPPDISKDNVKTTPTPSQKPGEDSPSGGENTDDDPIDDFDGALDTERSDGVYTFLLVGRDHESNSTDTIIVGKLDTVNHTIDCVNIPRDTLINISWKGTPKKINAVYPGYTNSGRSGIEGLKTHIKNLIGFDVDCYAVVNLKVVEDVINEIGGVYFDVPMDMDYDDGAQHFHVHLKSGYQLLNGYEALGVFRYRYGNDGNTYPGGDIERIGVQQSLMKSIASQMLSLGNIPNLGNIIQLCVDNVETDLTAANMAFFARQFLMCKADDINFSTAPFSNSCFINGVSFVSLDVNQWLSLVNEKLNPFTEEITLSNVNMLTSNYDGTKMTATSGEISGGIDSFYCNKPGCELRFSGHAPEAHVLPGAEEDPVDTPEPEENAGDGGEGTEEGENTPDDPADSGETGGGDAEGPERIEVILP